MRTSIITSIANTKTVKRVVSSLEQNSKKVLSDGSLASRYMLAQDYLPTILNTWIYSIQAVYTMKSKDIPEDRKLPLALNIVLGEVFSIIGDILVAGQKDKWKDAIVKKFSKVIKDDSKLLNGLNTAVPIVLSLMMFRFVGPIIATPVADKLNDFLIKKGIAKKPGSKEKIDTTA